MPKLTPKDMKDECAAMIAKVAKAAAENAIADLRASPRGLAGAEIARVESRHHLERAAGILADLADDIERAAAHEGIVTAARGEFSAIRTCVIGDNIRDLRERAGHLRFLAATAFRCGETSAA